MTLVKVKVKVNMTKSRTLRLQRLVTKHLKKLTKANHANLNLDQRTRVVLVAKPTNPIDLSVRKSWQS